MFNFLVKFSTAFKNLIYASTKKFLINRGLYWNVTGLQSTFDMMVLSSMKFQQRDNLQNVQKVILFGHLF